MENLPIRKEQNEILDNNIFVFLSQTENFINDKKELSLRDSNPGDFLNIFWNIEILKRHRQDEFSNHTIRAYKNDARTLIEFLNTYNINLKEIGFQEVKAYSMYINEKYAIKTAIRKLDFFRRVLLFGYRTHYYASNFAPDIEKPKSFKGHYSSKDVKKQRNSKNEKDKELVRTRELSDKDAKIIIEYFEDIVKDNPRNQSFKNFLILRNKLIGWLLFGTGMRASELISLKFGSFFEEDDVLYVEVVGKGNKQRSIPILSQTLCNLLEEHKQSVKNRYDITDRALRKIPVLFSPVGIKKHEDIKAMSYNNLYKLVKEAVVLAEKNPDVSPHWFRHTYITFLLSEDVPLATVMDNAGHSNIATTNIYLETINKRKKHKHMKHVNFD